MQHPAKCSIRRLAVGRRPGRRTDAKRLQRRNRLPAAPVTPSANVASDGPNDGFDERPCASSRGAALFRRDALSHAPNGTAPARHHHPADHRRERVTRGPRAVRWIRPRLVAPQASPDHRLRGDQEPHQRLALIGLRRGPAPFAGHGIRRRVTYTAGRAAHAAKRRVLLGVRDKALAGRETCTAGDGHTGRRSPPRRPSYDHTISGQHRSGFGP